MKAKAVQTAIYLATETYNALIDGLVAAASTLSGLPELVDRNELVIALGEIGNVWPAAILEADA